MVVSGQLHAQASLPPGINTLNRGVGGPQSRSGRPGKDTNLLYLPGFERRIIQSVA